MDGMRLIVLNGPGASGKSTLASRYAAEHPFTLNLDIDRILDLIGGWKTQPRTAGLQARAIGIAAVRVHLTSGDDAIVPQLVARPEFYAALEEVADEVGAEFHEVVLLDEREAMLARFHARTAAAQQQSHVDVADGVDDTRLREMYDNLLAFLNTRPKAITVPSIDGDPDTTYAQLLEAMNRNQSR